MRLYWAPLPLSALAHAGLGTCADRAGGHAAGDERAAEARPGTGDRAGPPGSAGAEEGVPDEGDGGLGPVGEEGEGGEGEEGDEDTAAEGGHPAASRGSRASRPSRLPSHAREGADDAGDDESEFELPPPASRERREPGEDEREQLVEKDVELDGDVKELRDPILDM